MLKNKKQLTTLLLVLSCLSSGIILATVPAQQTNSVVMNSGLDSLIVTELKLHDIPESQYRRYDIEVDSTFSRTVYRVQVPPSFSKTTFHFKLHKKLYPHDLTSPAKVIFPERNMNIYIMDRGTIRSTIRLITTDPSDLNE